MSKDDKLSIRIPNPAATKEGRKKLIYACMAGAGLVLTGIVAALLGLFTLFIVFVGVIAWYFINLEPVRSGFFGRVQTKALLRFELEDESGAAAEARLVQESWLLPAFTGVLLGATFGMVGGMIFGFSAGFMLFILLAMPAAWVCMGLFLLVSSQHKFRAFIARKVDRLAEREWF